MDEISQSRNGQYLEPIDPGTAEALATDPDVVGLLMELNWRTSCRMDLGDRADDLLRLGILREDGDGIRISEPYQAFGSMLDGPQGVCTALTAPKCGWFHDLGFLTSYVVCSLISLMFDIEPVWEGESLMLAERAGLVEDRHLTDRGRDAAFSLFSVVAGIFDTGKVDPSALLERWASPSDDPGKGGCLQI